MQIAVGQRRRVLNSFKTFKCIMKLNLNGYTIWIDLTRIKKCMQTLPYFEIVFFLSCLTILRTCGITARVKTFLFKVHDIRVFAYRFA